jgi:hypothetical protein
VEAKTRGHSHATGRKGESMMSQAVPEKKLLELARRLILGTEQDAIVWEHEHATTTEQYCCNVADTRVVIIGGHQKGEVSVKLFDPGGRMLVSLEPQRLKEGDTLLEDLFRAVRLNSGGVEKIIDRTLEHLPKETLRSV